MILMIEKQFELKLVYGLFFFWETITYGCFIRESTMGLLYAKCTKCKVHLAFRPKNCSV